jgi:DNA modification methylase
MKSRFTEFVLKVEDCVKGMRALEKASVDLVVTSPPYNLGIKYKTYDDNRTLAAYLKWSEEWAMEVKRVLKPNGSFFLNIGGCPSAPLLPHKLVVVFENNGAASFSAGDVKQWPEFLNKLRRKTDAVSAFVWRHLSPAERETLMLDHELRKWATDVQIQLLSTQSPSCYLPDARALRYLLDEMPKPSMEQAGMVVAALNRILSAECVYEPARFQGIALRPETVELLEQKPKGHARAHLNRLLFEDAYPSELSRGSPNLFRLQNTFHWVKSITVETTAGQLISTGHFKPIQSKRFVTDCHEYVFHLTKDGNVPIDRLAVGVPYSDKSNIARWDHTSGRDLRCRGNNWFVPYKTIVSRSKERPHPATFPVQLAEFCIKIHGCRPDLVMLDPFVGIGHSAKAAEACRVQKFIGFDIEKDYIDTTWIELKKQNPSVFVSASQA